MMLLRFSLVLLFAVPLLAQTVAGVVRDDSGRGTVRLKSRPETLPVSAPFMALFRHM